MTHRAKRCAVAALAMAATVAATADASGIARQRAAELANRAASARVERFAIRYPPGTWKADCARRSGGWRCAVGTGGQCSGTVTVTGTKVRPRVAKIDVSCFE
jgi:ADP-ribosylglycohydrolase